jgi:nitrile hydratase subunit beta
VTHAHVMFGFVAALSDIGGRGEYFGPIVREPGEPVFHSRSEGRVFGISAFVLSLVGRNVDAFRFATAQLPSDVYMSSYYRRMLGGCEKLLVRAGYLGPDEVDARVEGRRATPGARQGSRLRLAIVARLIRSSLRPALPRWLCANVLPRIFGASRPPFRRRRFAVGERVRVRAEQAAGHTRQPGYVTGKPGVITAHLGATLFPDAHAAGRRARPQHLYTVAFDGGDLWGTANDGDTEVRVDLYEPYLEPA